MVIDDEAGRRHVATCRFDYVKSISSLGREVRTSSGLTLRTITGDRVNYDPVRKVFEILGNKTVTGRRINV